MKKLIAICFAFLCLGTLHAQTTRWTIKGMIQDSTGQALDAVTIVLLKRADSSLVAFGRTNDQGAFTLRNIKPKETYILKLNMLGYLDYSRNIGPESDSSIVDLGKITLQDASHMLREVVINEQYTPMKIIKDTMEFNSAAFKTQPNANVEDMLKKMPGMEVDKDGNITSQGKTVTQVLVDGKKFFGKDPKIATRNLPADVVDRVQVFDKKSDQSEFSGIDDGERETTINLKLKANAKTGTFGSLGAAAGTDQRYDARASINKFDGKRQLSFIGMANNLNQTGFSISDYMSYSGDAQRMMGGQGGIRMQSGGGSGGGSDQSIPIDFGGTRRGTGLSNAAGLNFNQTFGKTEINASYFYNLSNTFIHRIADRETFYTTGNLLDHSLTDQDNQRQTNRLTTQIDQKLDSFNSLRFNGNLSYNNTPSSLLSSSIQSKVTEELNTVERNTTTDANALNFQGTLLYRLRFHKRGRFFTSTFNLNTNDNNTDADYRTITQYLSGSPLTQDSIFQNTVKTNDRRMYSIQGSYTEPIAKRRYLELNASHRETNTNYNQLVYDLVRGRSLNEGLSDHYTNLYSYNKIGTNYRIAEKEVNITAGLNLQQSILNGRQKSADNKLIKKDFVNLVPTLRMEYDLQNGRNLNMNYEASVREPSIDQISPIIDNSNPRNITEGNPDLRTEYSHNLNLNYRQFNMASFTNLFAFAGLTYNQHPIIYSQRVDDQYRTFTKPINLDKSTLNFFSNLNYGFQIKPIKLRVQTGLGLNGLQSYSFVQLVQNKTLTNSVNGRINLEFRPSDIFEWSNGIRRALSNTKYSVNNLNNQKSITTTYTSDIMLNYKGFVFTTSLNYYIYRGLSTAFNQEVPILGATLSKSFLKNNRLELKLTANDLLKRNIGINRTTNINYIEDERVNTLTRYFLVGVNYILRGTPQMMGGRGMRPPRMMMN